MKYRIVNICLGAYAIDIWRKGLFRWRWRRVIDRTTAQSIELRTPITRDSYEKADCYARFLCDLEEERAAFVPRVVDRDLDEARRELDEDYPGVAVGEFKP